MTRRRALGLLLLVGLALGPGGLRRARAAGLGRITPGESTRRDVEAEYGKPSRDAAVVQEGRTVAEWTYAADRAPKGFTRMVVAFGSAGTRKSIFDQSTFIVLRMGERERSWSSGSSVPRKTTRLPP